EVGGRMNSTGLTTLFNTLGATLGPLLGSFVLLPAIGFQWSLLLCAAGYAVLTMFASEWRRFSFRTPGEVAATVLSAAFLLLLTFFPYHRVERSFAHASLPYQIDEQGQFVARVVKKVE